MSFKTPIQLSEFNECPENYYRASNGWSVKICDYITRQSQGIFSCFLILRIITNDFVIPARWNN